MRRRRSCGGLEESCRGAVAGIEGQVAAPVDRLLGVAMQYVRLGATGLKVSRICLGMMSYGDAGWREWVIGEPDAEPFVRRAAEAGINFFDTADVYSGGTSEEVTGRLLNRVFD